MSAIQSVLAALYLRGLQRPVEPHSRAWPAVLSLLRRASIGSALEAAEVLRGGGFSGEAACLAGRALEHAERLVESELVVTAASPFYPRAWVEKLGAGAPPALYARGALELLSTPCFGIVGSRNPPAKAFRTAVQVVEAAGNLGFTIVSGGAPGIDRAAGAAEAFIEVWPGGLGLRWGARKQRSGPSLHLSIWPPRELFSTAGAMERNTLVYALAQAAFVGHARFKQGGSWHGATSAFRRRLTRILVTAEPWTRADEPARRALLGLGAIQLHGVVASELNKALAAEPLQPWLPAFTHDPAIASALAAY